MNRLLHRSALPAAALVLALSLTACKDAPPPAPAMQAMPVMTSTVAFAPIPTGDTYIATIKSRRSATIQPQVDGNLTRILVHSGQSVTAGEVLMTIDPLKQEATVQQQKGTELQAKATADYNKIEANRQKQLFEAGVISRDAYDIATQNLGNSTGAYNAAVQGTRTQQQELAYYQIRAPFAGIVGDIPVHQGDYVSPTTLLTTVDENKDLEAYIYIPTERATQVKLGLPVDLLDNTGKVLAHSTLDFVSPEVDNGTQTILAKAAVPASAVMLRNLQLIQARVTWATVQAPSIPVLAVTRIGGQTFVYVAAPKGEAYAAHLVAVTLGDAIGNNFPVLSGLKAGDKVILSGIQFLGEGAPVKPLAPPPGPPPAAS